MNLEATVVLFQIC